MTDSIEHLEEPKKSILGKVLSLILPLGLGVVIIYFLVRDIDPAELWAIMKDANWAILLFSLLFGLLGHTIRGFRWRLLINVLGYAPKISKLCLSIFGGYAINYAIPRAGELWRCGIIAKDEKVPFSKLFGTMLLDRVFDTVTVICITLVAVGINMKFFVEQMKHNEKMLDSITATLKSPTPYILILVGLLAIYAIFKYWGNSKIVRKIKDLFKSIWKDMKDIWKMKDKHWLLLQTVGIWLSYFGFFYITFYAFDFTKDLGFTAGLIAFALSSISMAVPSNGGLGPWQVAVIAALTLYNVDPVSAIAFSTGVFMLQSVWQILVGLTSIGLLSFMKKRDTPPVIEGE